MTTTRRTRELKIRRIVDLLDAVAAKRFPDDREMAFLYWASNLHLDQADNPPTQNELLDGVTDGKDDLEIDAFYVDEGAKVVYLFQSKFRTTPGTISPVEFSRFLDAPTNLTTPKVLTENTNQKILDFAPVFREKIRDGFQLQLIYVTTLASTDQVGGRAQKWNDDKLTLDAGGDRVDVPHNVLVSDLDDLTIRLESVTRQAPVDVTLKMLSYQDAPAGKFKCIVGSVAAEELARLFHTWRFAMFRYNPRGPLGGVATNKEIKQTLSDPAQLPYFHLLNNGLSAVCEALTVQPGGEIRIKDFQIVNGCQTTYTLWDHWRRGGSLGEAQVILKLVEGQTLRTQISHASNSQSPMRDWDFLFNDETQKRLQIDFRKMSPPVFYELRRGEWRYIEADTRAERVTVKDIAQATWAFMGYPGEAKDKLREIPRSRAHQSGEYHNIFHPKVSAMYLLLPWRVYQRVEQEYLKHYQQVQQRGDHREHGRLHIVWLIGRALALALKRNSYKDVSDKEAGTLCSRIDDWFDDLHSIAVDTITYVTDVERRAAEKLQQPLSLRQLFRSASNYPDFMKAHDARLAPALLTKVRNLVT